MKSKYKNAFAHNSQIPHTYVVDIYTGSFRGFDEHVATKQVETFGELIHLLNDYRFKWNPLKLSYNFKISDCGGDESPELIADYNNNLKYRQKYEKKQN